MRYRRSQLKLIKKTPNIPGELGVAKRRIRLEIYNLKEGNVALISLQRFSFSEHSN